jgi:hypothetical protein
MSRGYMLNAGGPDEFRGVHDRFVRAPYPCGYHSPIAVDARVLEREQRFIAEAVKAHLA